MYINYTNVNFLAFIIKLDVTTEESGWMEHRILYTIFATSGESILTRN